MYRLFLFLLTLYFAGCVPSGNAEEEKVRSVIHEIVDAGNRGDLEKVLSLYHAQATLVQLMIEIEDLKVSRDFAVCHGFTRGQVVIKSDSTVREINDRYMMTLEKENGAWKIKRLMWGAAIP